MHTKLAICIVLLLAVVSCSDSVDELDVIDSGCESKSEIFTRFLVRGANDKSEWITAFEGISEDFLVREFLSSWVAGQSYEITYFACFENDAQNEVISVDILTSHVGEIDLSAEIVNEEIAIFSFMISSFAIFE